MCNKYAAFENKFVIDMTVYRYFNLFYLTNDTWL